MPANGEAQERHDLRHFLTSSSLPQAFVRKASEKKGAVLFRKRLSRDLVTVTWDEALARIEHFGAALIRAGFAPGDCAAVMADNGPGWAVADFAIQAAGGRVVPVFCTSSEEQIRHILCDSGAAFFFAGSPRFMARGLASLEGAGAEPRCVVLGGRPAAGSGAVALETFLGPPPTAGEKRELESRTAALTRDDVSAVIYTSGTTGPPKGVVLTHGNILSNILGGRYVFTIDDDDVFLSLLPLSHSFERTMGFYAPVLSGACVHFAQSAGTLTRDLLEARPTVVMVVPRFLEKMRQKIQATVDGLKGPAGALARAALHVRLAAARSIVAGRRPPVHLALAAPLATAMIGARFRQAFGGRTRLLFSGGAALSREVWAFFKAIGIRVVEGYGLTESAPVISCNPPLGERPGSVGLPLENLEVRIADDGEILARGPNIMRGYHNDPEATAAAVDAEGFLHTGDIGRLDGDGFLFITDRKKDIIVSAAGKNIAPQNVENTLCLSPFIEYACVFGEGRNFLVALLSPDLEVVRERVRGEGLAAKDDAELVAHPAVTAVFQSEVDAANASLAPYERVFRFHVVDKPFSMEGGEITTTLKVRRRFIVEEKYGDVIEGLFRS